MPRFHPDSFTVNFILFYFILFIYSCIKSEKYVGILNANDKMTGYTDGI
jgi:hypothetical protein